MRIHIHHTTATGKLKAVSILKKSKFRWLH